MIRVEDISNLAQQGHNEVMLVDSKPVLRVKDYLRRNYGVPISHWCFYEPNMLISSRQGIPWEQSNPLIVQLPGCNLQQCGSTGCTYCFNAINAPTIEVDPKSIMQAVAKHPTRTLRISGGEPLWGDNLRSVKELLAVAGPEMLIWVDTNLTQDVDWNELGDINDYDDWLEIVVCGSFKGFTQEIVNKYSPGVNLDDQFRIAKKLWDSDVDMVFYYVPALTKDNREVLYPPIIEEFISRLVNEVSSQSVYATTILEIHNYNSCKTHMKDTRSCFNHYRDVWNNRVDVQRHMPMNIFAQRSNR